MDNNIEPMLIDAIKAAKLCGISRALIYKMIDLKEFPQPIKVGRKTLWNIEVLRRWIRLSCPNQLAMKRLIKKQQRKESAQRVKCLSDGYIKQILCDKTFLQFKDIPQNLVDLKRAFLRLRKVIEQERK